MNGIGEWFSEKFSAIKEIIIIAFGVLVDFFSQVWDTIVLIWETVVQWFYDNIIEPLKAEFEPLFEWFTQLFTNIWNFISSFFQVIVELAKGCVESIKIIWEIIVSWVDENIVQPLTNFFSSLWNGIKDSALNAWNGIKEIWTIVSEWFNENIIGPISNIFISMWDTLKNGASNAWQGIKNVFSSVTDWFRDVFSKAWEAVKNVFSTGGKIFDGIKEGIESTFKTVVNRNYNRN